MRGGRGESVCVYGEGGGWEERETIIFIFCAFSSSHCLIEIQFLYLHDCALSLFVLIFFFNFIFPSNSRRNWEKEKKKTAVVLAVRVVYGHHTAGTARHRTARHSTSQHSISISRPQTITSPPCCHVTTINSS